MELDAEFNLQQAAWSYITWLIEKIERKEVSSYGCDSDSKLVDAPIRLRRVP